jgi:hypothetical protein
MHFDGRTDTPPSMGTEGNEGHRAHQAGGHHRRATRWRQFPRPALFRHRSSGPGALAKGSWSFSSVFVTFVAFCSRLIDTRQDQARKPIDERDLMKVEACDLVPSTCLEGPGAYQPEARASGLAVA